MCGIVGFTGSPKSDVLRRMCRSLVHRGPDDERYFHNSGISLGIRRLAIVDLQNGRQPICNETGDIWIVFNGEIYNHVELRRELESKQHSFRTDHSDTEVIVHLYEEYGEDWPIYVNGMFGVALWDNREQKLLLYRDRIGKKPLYYALKNDQIVFGSEVKAIIKHPLISRDLDCRALYHYFALKNISAPATAYADIKQLLPGHLLVWHRGKSWVRPYWKLDFSRPLTDVSEQGIVPITALTRYEDSTGLNIMIMISSV